MFLNTDRNLEVRETYSLGTAPYTAALVRRGENGVLDALTTRANLALDERVDAIHTEFEAHLQTAPTDNSGSEPSISESTTDVATIEDVRGLHDVANDDRTGADTTVVVMDTGIDPSHRSVPNAIEWVDMTDNPTGSPTDIVGHGTAMAGQISRLSPDASLIGLRIFGDKGSTSGRTVMRAYDWLFKNADQLDVVNMSWGVSERIPELDKVHNALIERGVCGVVAAGNSGEKGGSPATADKAFSIGAVTEDGVLAEFSSYNPEQDNPDVCAIGKDCRLAQASGTNMGTNLHGPWTKASGTSFSVPVVSGMVAKLLSGDTSVAPPKITSAFESGAADIPDTPRDGAGIAEYQAVRKAVGGQSNQSDQSAKSSLARSDSATVNRIDHLESRIDRLETEDTASAAQVASTEASLWKDTNSNSSNMTNSIKNTRPKYGVVNRPLMTTDHQDVWVGHGEFGTGKGTKAEPFGTIQDALNAMPIGIYHKYNIQLTQGVHNNEPGNSLNSGWHYIDGISSANVKIIGDQDNSENHAMEANQMNLQFYSSALSMQIEGVDVRGTLQNYNTAMTLDSSTVTSGNRWGRGNSVSYDCYGGYVIFLDSNIRGDHPAFNLTEGGEVYTGGSVNIDVNAPLAETGIGGGVFVPNSNTSVNCNGNITQGREPAPVIVRDVHGATDHLNDSGYAIRQG